MIGQPDPSHPEPEDDFDSATDPGHVPVLAEEVLRFLDPRPGMVVLDCTLGRGGHAKLIAPRLAPGGAYVGLDVDPVNIAYGREVLAGSPVPTHLVRSNFADARVALDSLGIEKVDAVLADLGFASSQMTDAERGFSFRADGPLDMRLDPTLGQTAADLVNHMPERELADLIYRYGEERMSRKIARKIVEERGASPIKTTTALAEVVRRAYGPAARRSRIDPATRTFMALRIAVNDELGVLERLLEQLPSLLAPQGKAAIISFHSLEDRLVKHAFQRLEQDGRFERVTRKPVTAGDAERRTNPRSRSAKMRVLAGVESGIE